MEIKAAVQTFRPAGPERSPFQFDPESEKMYGGEAAIHCSGYAYLYLVPIIRDPRNCFLPPTQRAAGIDYWQPTG
jgi:hypothetical protein